MIYLGTQLLLLRYSCFFVIAMKLKAKDDNRITSIVKKFYLNKSERLRHLPPKNECRY